MTMFRFVVFFFKNAIAYVCVYQMRRVKKCSCDISVAACILLSHFLSTTPRKRERETDKKQDAASRKGVALHEGLQLRGETLNLAAARSPLGTRQAA